MQLIYFLIIFLTNIVQIISGFAGTMLAMPFSVRIIGYEQSRFILNLLGLLASIYIVINNMRNVDFKKTIKIIVIMFLGIIVSRFLNKNIQFDILMKLYGLLIIGVAIYQFVGKDININNFQGILILFISGVIHGLFVSGGALLVIYASNVFKSKDEFRSNLSLVWVFLNTILLISMIQENIIIDYGLTLKSIIAMIIAFVVGNWILPKIDLKLFKKITNVLLLITGLSILL